MHQQEAPTVQPPSLAISSQQGTCLIIEDSAFDIEKLTRVIVRNMPNMDIKVATTLQSAREELADGDTTLILLDNNLPDGLGANFVQELADIDQLANIPVIMVSDWPSPFMWEKAASAGVHYVLNKREFDAHYIVSALEQNMIRRPRAS